MKNKNFLAALLLFFAAELAALFVFAFWDANNLQDAIAVNEVLQSAQRDWKEIENHENQTDLDYVLLTLDGAVLWRTRAGLSEGINAAVRHRDTILDIEAGTEVVGKLIIYNDSEERLLLQKQAVIFFLAGFVLLQCIACVAYTLYLERRIKRPFHKLKGFAERIAGGNLDIPLEMDRQNLFGAFTESFDIMRAELKAARKAEAEANASKKELVAKLSHDIKTPVASIKAVSELGAALAADEKIKENYIQIIRKADQITALVTNLFTATLEELEQLSVTPEDMESLELRKMLENADYFHRAVLPVIPDCMVFADRLRLQQVFDNIFANSYKYADTQVLLLAEIRDGCLAVCIEDFGGGVKEEELPFIKEKFRRGSNAEHIEGAGLGLYISDYFMKEMKGELLVKNGTSGLKVMVLISLSGTI